MSAFNHPINLMVAICCLVFISIIPAEAGVSASIGTGYLAGDTQYQIGGKAINANGVYEIHFPLSELKFPLDAFMVKGTVTVDFAKRWTLMASAATNITDDTGKVEDSDWGIWEWSNPDTLDVYSESDTEMDALLLEGKIAFMFYQGYYGQDSINGISNRNIQFSYFAGLGYKYQRFDFEVSNLDQWYPTFPSVPHDLVPGLIGTYEAEYQIPYLELSMEMKVAEKFLLEIGLAYAPFVDFQDEDQHLLRDKVNVADHDWAGDAMFVRLKGRYNFNPHWFLELDAEAMKIESEGESNAYVHGVWNHSIEHEVKSEQYSAYLSIGASF
jgi:outer membrane protease